MSKKSVLHETFRQTMDQLREQLRHHIQQGQREAACAMADKISGAAEFARRLGVIDWEQYTDITEEAKDAALHGFPVETEL